MANKSISLERKLLDTDGENLAVRRFLAAYGDNSGVTQGQMRDHLQMSGFENCWPSWVDSGDERTTLTKGGAQDWLRFLFSLEAATEKGGVSATIGYICKADLSLITQGGADISISKTPRPELGMTLPVCIPQACVDEATDGEMLNLAQKAVDAKHRDERDGVDIEKWASNLVASTQSGGREAKTEEIVTALYRRFKEWSERGFGPDDVTWCEVKADVKALIALTFATGFYGEWIDASVELPRVREGGLDRFLVAIRRAHDGKTYVIEASYLNAHVLSDANNQDEERPFTGWYEHKERDDYDDYYAPIDRDGDVVTYWMRLPNPPKEESNG